MPKPFKPENHTSDPDPGPLIAMIRAINSAPDAGFEDAMAPYLDLKRFLTQVAVEAYLAEQDGILGAYGLNNFYLYRFAGTTRFHFIPWDKSNAFWNLDRSIWTNADTNVLVRRALAVPELRVFL